MLSQMDTSLDTESAVNTKNTIESNNKTIDDLFALYQLHGSVDYIGENISQLDHALQCAALARWDVSQTPAWYLQYTVHPNVVIAAALLHDVGQLHGIVTANATICDEITDGSGCSLGVAAHEHLGADYLAILGFPKCMTDLIRLHVPAKRYLARSPKYRCSPASKGTLIHQGGPMNDLEATKFKHHPLFDEAILLRSYDDGAKQAALEVAPLESYREILLSVLSSKAVGKEESRGRRCNLL